MRTSSRFLQFSGNPPLEILWKFHSKTVILSPHAQIADNIKNDTL